MVTCPLGANLLWVRIWVKRFCREISVQTDSCKPASVPDTVLHEWTLPRAKQVSTGHLFTEVLQLPPPSSSHFSITIITTGRWFSLYKKRTPSDWMVFFFGCGGRTRTYDLRVMSCSQAYFPLLHNDFWRFLPLFSN